MAGLAGYLILDKALNVVKLGIKEVCEASKWRAYYKHGKDDVVPPGYRSTVRKIDDEHEFAIEDPKQVNPDGTDKHTEGPQESPAASLVNSVNKAVNDWLDKADERREAKKREREASGEVVSEYDENGKPIAKRYSYTGDTDGDNILWMDVNKSTAGENISKVQDSLENGVEVVTGNEEDVSNETLD